MMRFGSWMDEMAVTGESDEKLGFKLHQIARPPSNILLIQWAKAYAIFFTLSSIVLANLWSL